MIGLARMFLLASLGIGGGAAAAMSKPATSVETSSGQLLKQEQYRRSRPRCSTELRRMSFIDRIGRPRVGIVEKSVTPAVRRR